MDRSSQFAVPFVIIFFKFVYFCYTSIPYLDQIQYSPILSVLILYSFLAFIFTSTIILVLFVSLNDGKKYLAKWIIWVAAIIFFLIEINLTSISFRYILKLFEELPALIHLPDSNTKDLLMNLRFSVYLVAFYCAVFFILKIFIGPSAKANNIEPDNRYYHIATSLVYSILTSAILCRLMAVTLSTFMKFNNEDNSLLMSITLIMMSCIFLNTLVSAAACYQNLNTPQNRINIRKIITTTTIYVLLVILLSYVIYLISTHLITQFGHFTSPEITMTGLMIFGFLCFLLVSYQIQKVILMKVFREQKVNQIVN